MKVLNTKLKGVKKIVLDPFIDHRGEYVEIYNYNDLAVNGIEITFCQDDISVSKRNVFKGIHGDDRTWKLISCLYGEFYLVVINCDKSSNNFGKHDFFLMTDKKRVQILVPPKFGNGHLILSNIAIFHYKQSTYYKGISSQFTYNIKDPFFNIWLPVNRNDLILSNRDRKVEFINE